MDRNREARRASIVGSNGFNRRRYRTNSLRDSPDEEGGMELQESVRLRDRVKKDRDRERDKDRERERERERERDSRERSCRSKRRRGERLTSNRENIGGDDTSEEESLNDDEDDEDEETTTTSGGGGDGGGVRLLTQAVGSFPNHHHHHSHSSSFSQQHNSNTTSNTVSSNHLHHRKSFLPNPSSAKISSASPVWKTGDEMIGAPVPRKARSASTKRSHDWVSMNSGGVPGVEQNPGQASNSPARQGVVPISTPTPPAPMSPTSPNASIRKKPKPTVNNSGPKLKPPKVAAKPSSSNPEELEIEIAEVLFGLMTQSQAPVKKEDSREINRLSSDAKSRYSSAISSPSAANNLTFGSTTLLSAVAPKRKRPRQIPENSSYGARSSSTPAKPDVDQNPKSEASSLNREKNQGSAAENGYEAADPQAPPSEPPAPTVPGSVKMDSELKPAPEELKESRDSVAREEPKDGETPAVKTEVRASRDSPAAPTTKAYATSAEMENRKEEKFEIDLMAPPPQGRPSPSRESKTDFINFPVDQKPVVSIADAQVKPSSNDEADENGNCRRENGSSNLAAEEKKGEEVEKKERSVDLRIDLGKSERDGGDGFNATGNGNKSQPLTQKQQQQMPHSEKSGHSFPLPMSMASWPGGGLPPMGYIAPLQGVVSMEGGAVIPPFFPQPRPKRCATHCHIARNIHYLQQFTKMNPPFWPAPAPAAFGSKNVKGQNIPNHVMKESKGSQPASTNSDSSQRKQQILIQQSLPPPVGPSNLLGPTLIFPINQQQSGAPQPSGGAKSPSMGPNETQYLAILQNNGYTFPIPAGAVGAPRGGPMAQAMPLFNGSFYSPEMMHQLQPHQNACTSSGSSTSQNQLQQHLQSQQQRMQSISSQQSHHNNPYLRPRQHHEGEPGPEDSPSRTDSRGGSRPPMNMYGQNFAMPIHPQNLGLMTLASTGADKTQGGSKMGPGSSLPPAHSYAMSFGAMNGLGMEMAQNHAALFQNSSDVTRHKMAAAQKNLPVSDDGSKSGGVDSSSASEDKRSGKALSGGGRSIAFTRSDLAGAHASSSSLIESSSPSLNAAAPRSSRPMSTSNVGPMNLQNAHAIQAQLQQQHMLQQQFKQHQQQQQQQQQQQMVANASLSKVAGDIYSEHCSKFPSGFPQNLVQSHSSNSPSQSPQWKASTPQTPSSMASSNSTMLKHLPQHHSRTQISFGGSQKPLAAAASQGQLHPNNNQTVGSPTMSKGGGAIGSPRTSSTTNNKASSLSEQLPNQNSPSIPGNPHVSAAASSGSGQKPQTQQQSQHQMMKALLQQQQQLLYPNPYAQSQSHHLVGKSLTTSGTSGYYMARKQKDQHQQSPGGPATSAGGLSFGTNTNDPATAIAAATANAKGGGLPSQSIIHASQFAGGPLLPAGFSYAHPVPAAQVKPAEQKQPSGNEKLHPWHAEKK